MCSWGIIIMASSLTLGKMHPYPSPPLSSSYIFFPSDAAPSCLLDLHWHWSGVSAVLKSWHFNKTCLFTPNQTVCVLLATNFGAIELRWLKLCFISRISDSERYTFHVSKDYDTKTWQKSQKNLSRL